VPGRTTPPRWSRRSWKTSSKPPAASPPRSRRPPRPALLLALDEIGNLAPLPSLPTLMAEGGGTGITTMPVLQSLAQAREKWSENAAGAIWDASIVKIILGGASNSATCKTSPRSSANATRSPTPPRSATTAPAPRSAPSAGCRSCRPTPSAPCRSAPARAPARRTTDRHEDAHLDRRPDAAQLRDDRAGRSAAAAGPRRTCDRAAGART
jgi:hypothetical protein